MSLSQLHRMEIGCLNDQTHQNHKCQVKTSVSFVSVKSQLKCTQQMNFGVSAVQVAHEQRSDECVTEKLESWSLKVDERVRCHSFNVFDMDEICWIHDLHCCFY